LACMKADDFSRFNEDVVKWVGEVPSLNDLNKWLAAVMNIWNATPQPDRDSKTAHELPCEELQLDE
jgi:hypothetical protein